LNDPNYKLHSLSELNDALINIDRDQYPERTQEIIQEIEARSAITQSLVGSSENTFHEDLHSNLFIRYWKGQVSLPMSYWGVGITINLLFFVISKGVQIGIESSTHTWQLGAYILGLYTFLISAITWHSVGLYRTARKHPLRTGDSGWATIALIMLFIGLVGFFQQMHSAGIPIIKSGFQLIAGADKLPNTEFRILNEGNDIELIGRIDLGSESLLEEQLRLNPNVNRIHLHSNGGRVLAAKRMMKIIRRYNLDTYVKTECASACTLLYLAGKNRLLAEEAKLKFHAPGIGGASSHNIEELGQHMKEAYVGENLPHWFINKVMETPNDEFWEPTSEELLRANVIDKIVDSDLYPMSGLGQESSITVEALESGLLTVEHMVAMKKHDSEAYQQVIDLNLNGMLAGITKNELSSQVNNLIYSERLPVYLSNASNEALVEYWKSQINHMKELKANYPLACASLTYPEIVPVEHRYGNEGTISPKVRSQELAALANLIRSFKDEHLNIDETTEKELIQEVIANVRKQNEELYKVVVSAGDYVGEPHKLCEASIVLNEAFISFDVDTSGQLLRSL
jgi:ATP-dependent protease ClpP protease subunit/cupin superfamily acireductone dioxygenase involved in methionine salvage